MADEDPYLDPSWGGLRNKVGATSAEELSQAEAGLVEARTQQLRERPIKPTFDLAHLRAIHRHLFQDVYDWAGELRTVDMAKGGDSVGFLPHSRFNFGVQAVFEGIQDRNFRPGMERTAFIRSLTRTYDELNHLHPFREGNGRTQRVFLSQLAERAGYQLDWPRVTDLGRNDEVSRAAGHGDLEPMRQLLDDIAVPIADAPPSAGPATGRAPRGRQPRGATGEASKPARTARRGTGPPAVDRE